jgi:endonuclease G
MKSKWTMQLLLVALFFYGFTSASAQVKHVENSIFTVDYDESLEQPIKLSYTVQCPTGGADRHGLNFWKVEGYHTSDNDDYKNNPYDKGHLAPAAAFNCTRDMVKSTFSYLNCALQHEGLNRGPWKELEAVERNLAMFYTVDVTIWVIFDSNPERVPGGAAIPKAFKKQITFNDQTYEYFFPNEDVAGQDWYTFGTEGNPVKE